MDRRRICSSDISHIQNLAIQLGLTHLKNMWGLLRRTSPSWPLANFTSRPGKTLPTEPCQVKCVSIRLVQLPKADLHVGLTHLPAQ